MTKKSSFVRLALMTSIYIGMRRMIEDFLPILSVTDVSPDRLPGFLGRGKHLQVKMPSSFAYSFFKHSSICESVTSVCSQCSGGAT
jgi:hypothetical protein